MESAERARFWMVHRFDVFLGNSFKLFEHVLS